MNERPTDQHTREILDLLRQGRSDAKIARRLGISRAEVREAIDAIISDARLDDVNRVEELADELGITSE